MNKLFLGIASMIVTHFLLKVYDKMSHEPPTKEEVYRLMRAEREKIKAMYASSMPKFDAVSTPRDGAKMMAAIGTVQQTRDALRPSNDLRDTMAMAPRRLP